MTWYTVSPSVTGTRGHEYWPKHTEATLGSFLSSDKVLHPESSAVGDKQQRNQQGERDNSPSLASRSQCQVPRLGRERGPDWEGKWSHGGLVLKYMWEAPKYISIFCLTADSPPLNFIMKPAIQVEDPCGVSAVPVAGSLCRRHRKGGRRCFSCSFLHGVVSVTVCFRSLPQWLTSQSG